MATYHDAEYTIPVVVKGPPGPMIDKLEPNSGPPGTILRLTGVHFGDTRDSNAITINGLPAEPVTWNDTVLSVAVPDNLPPGKITIVVTARGTPSNGQDFTVLARGHGEPE